MSGRLTVSCASACASACEPELPMTPLIWQSIVVQLKLSPQQTLIAESILRGNQDKQIAEELDLSVATVRTYLNRIFERTDVRDRLNLVLKIFKVAQQMVSQNNDVT